MNCIWILAQGETDQAPSTIGSTPVTDEQETVPMTKQADPNQKREPAGRPPGPLGQYGTWIIFGLMFVMLYFILFRGPQKQKQQHRQMVQSLKKNDRVRTIGGIIGTVVDVRDDEITLKIDESNNTKIRIAPSAIGKNLSQDN
ncbi:MAG: preprotein translocase subunit YajC [Planctomycetota bacterium]|jgi:preprotein translocase subunit YajC